MSNSGRVAGDAPSIGQIKIMEDLQHGDLCSVELSKRCKISRAALYGRMQRMKARGWVQQVEGARVKESGKQPQVWALTDEGRHVLADHVLSTFVDRFADAFCVGDRTGPTGEP